MTLLSGGCNWVDTDTLKGDSLGTEIFMKMLHDSYPLTIENVAAILANPMDIPLEFGWDWHFTEMEWLRLVKCGNKN